MGGSGCSSNGVRSRGGGRGMGVGMVLLTHRSAMLPAWLHPSRSVKKHPTSGVLTGRPHDVAPLFSATMPAQKRGTISAAYSAVLYSAGQSACRHNRDGTSAL